MLIPIYQNLTRVAAPFLKLYLKNRLKKGKEDEERLTERYGNSSVERPDGQLIWCHAASVGESMSLLPVIHHLKQQSLNVLVTTGTVTSAKVMCRHLPKGVIHQFIPLDVPKWVCRFLGHWQPSLGIFIESELWPNILIQCKRNKIPLVLANASLSEKSYAWWKKFPETSQILLSSFRVCLTQSEICSNHLLSLGAMDVRTTGNLKFSVPPLVVNSENLCFLKKVLDGRVAWVAASTHPGEEEQIIKAHYLIKKKMPSALTILAPRHPERAESIKALIHANGLTMAQRSLQELPTSETDIYLADTVGELGLFYRLCPVSFIGGSFVPTGGHNPIEPIKLNSCVLWGPYHHNFSDISSVLGTSILEVKNQEDLAKTVTYLFNNPQHCQMLSQQASALVENQQSGLNDLMEVVSFFLKNAESPL